MKALRMIARWRHMMSSRVTIANLTGRDAQAKPTFGSATTYQCHLSRKRRLVTNMLGNAIDSGQAIYLDNSVAVEPTSRVTLSSGDIGSTEASALNPKIISVERRFDQSGPHHIVVYLE